MNQPAVVNLEDALRFDPFAGDFGDSGDRTLRDKIVKIRKPCECSWCHETAPVGSRCRSRVEIFDGSMESYKWCETCTTLMARVATEEEDDAEEELEKRIKIGRS